MGDPYGYYPPPYYNYYQYPPAHLSPPPIVRQRAHSHGRVNETNVYVPQYSPDPRGRAAVDHLADEVHHLARATSHARSRSRSWSDVRSRRSRSRSLSSVEAENRRLHRDLHLEREHKDEEERKKEIISRYEHEQAEKKRKEKEKMEEMKEKIRMQEILEKEKKEKEWKAYEEERERRIAEEKLKKKKEEEKAAEATRHTLRNAGYSENQIDRIMAISKKDKEKEVVTHTKSTTISVPPNHHAAGDIIVAGGAGPARTPVFPRAKRSDISPEVLALYGIRYHDDPLDSRYIIIHTEANKGFLEELNEETRRHKKGKKVLMIEERKPRERLAIVRKRRSRSRSRSRAGGDRIVVLNR